MKTLREAIASAEATKTKTPRQIAALRREYLKRLKQARVERFMAGHDRRGKVKINPTELQGVIELAKQEILRDVANGIVPATVRDYSQLHDYVDANKYGGAFEDTAHSCADSDFWNAMQDAVNGWIKDGGLQQQ